MAMQTHPMLRPIYARRIRNLAWMLTVPSLGMSMQLEVAYTA